MIPYRLASFPRDGDKLRDWLSQLYKPGQLIQTFQLLSELTSKINKSFQYVRREESGRAGLPRRRSRSAAARVATTRCS